MTFPWLKVRLQDWRTSLLCPKTQRIDLIVKHAMHGFKSAENTSETYDSLYYDREQPKSRTHRDKSLRQRVGNAKSEAARESNCRPLRPDLEPFYYHICPYDGPSETVSRLLLWPSIYEILYFKHLPDQTNALD